MLPPFEQWIFDLVLTRPAVFHFNHGSVLRGVVGAALGVHELPAGLVPFAPESGRVRFEPGEPYRLAVTLVGGARSLAEPLAAGLSRGGAAEPARDAPLPTLGGNFRVASAKQLAEPDLASETEALRGRTRATLQFVSPFRMARPPQPDARGRSFFDAGFFSAPQFLSRLWNRIFLLRSGRYATKDEQAALCPPVPPGVVATPLSLVWLDVPVEGMGAASKGHPRGYTLGGVVGKVVLDGLGPEWLALLVEGQYVHAGASTNYGLGRFRIVESPAAGSDGFRPVRSARERICDPSLLGRALDHVLERSDAGGLDGVGPEEAELRREEILGDLLREVRNGTYRATALKGFVERRAGCHARGLAIPTVRDRIAQRAACEVLGPAVDALLEDCSYAYRKGFSRVGAARALQAAYEAGYRFLLDADITSFFDSVGWKPLFEKLEALFPFEPLIEELKAWVTVPVVFEGREIRRARGLPQGASIAPLLANLVLDELDEDLLGKDYRLVRYADDFVVLCKDLESARRAHDDARAALERMGLTLNEEKTAIRSFDGGFSYLGYLFCRSVVLDQDGNEGEKTTDAVEADDIPSASWLAQVPFQRIRELLSRRPGDRRQGVEVVPLASADAPPRPLTRPLYVANPNATLHLSGETFVVEVPGEEPLRAPLRSLSHVVLYGRTRATVPLLLSLAKGGVPVYFCRRSGELYATMGTYAPDWPAWEAQGAFASDATRKLAFAREVVAAKLHNYAALAVRFKLQGAPVVADAIRDLERSCANKIELDSIRGLEGKGAALYFGAMAESLDGEWGFAGRRKNPPPDPVNAMLSFGYTLLYNHLSTAIIASGLHPRFGIYHEAKGAFHALAADLQEEFRHLIDALVWSLVHRREIHASDFAPASDGRYPCLFRPEARRRFLEQLEARLGTSFTPEPESARTTYRAHMDTQVAQIKSLVLGRSQVYRPLRAHA